MPHRQLVAITPIISSVMNKEAKNSLTERLQGTIFQFCEYKMREIDHSFVNRYNQIKFNKDGTIDDIQLIEFGYEIGVQFVCYVTVEKRSQKDFRIEYKLINVLKREVIVSGTENSKGGDLGLAFAIDNVALHLFRCGNSTSTGSYYKDKRHPAEPEMIFVEGGTFMMGCLNEDEDCDADEIPLHKVHISSFNIAKYPVTQGQWEAIMDYNPSNFQKGDDYPVENVSWMDVQEFICCLNAITGKQYRLPTEAEWEYAARGGFRNYHRYHFSGSHIIDSVAWYGLNSAGKTQPVGLKKPNELGIYDMSGNVWEWCSDWYGAYSIAEQTNPIGAETGKYRVFRGGSWDRYASDCRISFRGYSNPNSSDSILGFRLVHSEQ